MAEKESRKIKIAFTGDLSFSGYFRGKEREDILTPEVKKFLDDSRWTVINLESPVTDSGDTEKERLAHKCDEAAVDFILDIFAAPVVSLANNHMMDFGEKGLADTMKSLDRAGIQRLGAGRNIDEAARPVILESDGFRVGILAFQYKKTGTAGKNSAGPLHDSQKSIIRKTIKNLKKTADRVVVVYHGGEEFLHTPMPYNRKQLQKYISWGADAVVAHHPHTVHGYEFYRGKYIFYSLGNFIFDTDYQRVQKDSEDGMLLKLVFDPDSEKVEFQNLPIRINRDNQTVAAREKDPYFRDINHMDYESFWAEEAVRKKSVLADSNSIEKVGKKKLSRSQKIKKKLAESIKDPGEAKRKLTKKLYLKKGRKKAAGKKN